MTQLAQQLLILALLATSLAGTISAAGHAEPVKPAGRSLPPLDDMQLRRALKQAFPGADQTWRARLVPDRTMEQCADWHNKPPKEVATEIRERESGRIIYPEDDIFMGDWRRGERIAQSGYGLRFTDKDSTRATGGNCYACHQLSPDEVSFGTVGISLKGYGRTKSVDNPEDQRAVYEKIFNSQAAVACSLMPRFGTNAILNQEQIKDLVALLLDPDSPVNREKPIADERAGTPR